MTYNVFGGTLNLTHSINHSQKSHTYHITSSLLQHVLKMSASSTNASAQTLTPLANSTFNNRVTRC